MFIFPLPSARPSALCQLTMGVQLDWWRRCPHAVIFKNPHQTQKKGKEIKTVLPFFPEVLWNRFFCLLVLHPKPNNEIWPIKSLLTTNEQKLYSNSRKTETRSSTKRRKNSILKLLSAHFSFRSNFKITEFLFSILHKADMLGRPGCEMLSIKTS